MRRSHAVELAGLYEYEHDDETLEFYDQPPAIKLVYAANNGQQVGVWHTPDYFVIRSEAIGWEEWKTEAGLERWLNVYRGHVISLSLGQMGNGTPDSGRISQPAAYPALGSNPARGAARACGFRGK